MATANLIPKRQAMESSIIASCGVLANALLGLNDAWIAFTAAGFASGANTYVDADFIPPNDYLLATNFDDLKGVVGRLSAFLAGTGTLAAGDFEKLVVAQRASST